MEFTFILTEEEAQKTVDTLGKEPYLEVADLIHKLHQQAHTQRQEKNK
ncbi:hypothetical protein ABG775_02970 [Peribacillus simplex]